MQRKEKRKQTKNIDKLVGKTMINWNCRYMSYIIFLKEHSTKMYFQAEPHVRDAYFTLRLPRR